jgi:predicted RNA binding protein YcfA (HicA-like mRNA interferase family)
MTDTITFSSLDQFLRGLGFTEEVVPGSHVLYEHAGSGAVIVLRPFREEEDVGPTTIALVRHILDEFGVMDHKVFDDRVSQRLQAG